MGWSIGWDENHKRDIGYGVPSICDHPSCDIEINRGLGHVCGGEPYGGEDGCGLHFCGQHLYISMDDGENPQLCNRCVDGEEQFTPKDDTQEWVDWKLTDESWEQWRNFHPEEVKRLRERQ